MKTFFGLALLTSALFADGPIHVDPIEDSRIHVDKIKEPKIEEHKIDPDIPE